MASQRLALFDLDGTLTAGDTMFAFVFHCRGTLRTWLGLLWLSPLLALHAAGLVAAAPTKAAFLRHFLGGFSREALEAWARSFADHLEANIRPEARSRLQWHREQGHDIVVVSASLDLWLAPWAARHGLTLLCTQGQFEQDVFTGQLATPNCNGPEKETRIRASCDLSRYEYIYAYGDSSGDTEMLALAHEPCFRPFRTS